ncbi:maleylpyruvate isomerase N-terminal domain-containing protein [Streptomyces sp. NPDC050636]|uniref:maleylpyruvate isomerase N-terminal domain-containing protein n=1 Tax=Streptomyces sp. NPDC050636 TaxID=3154510 RepID=UPI0034242A21
MENATERTRSKAEVSAAIAAERRELADLFDSLRADEWNEPSLCTGWRVREVAAHMSMGFRLSLPATLAELAKARGNLHRMTDQVARSTGGRPTGFDKTLYKRRNEVERTINALKGFRAVATRFDKRAYIFHGTVTIAAIRLWLRS